MTSAPWCALAAMIAPRRLQSLGTASLQSLAMTSSVRSTLKVAARADSSATGNHVRPSARMSLVPRALLGVSDILAPVRDSRITRLLEWAAVEASPEEWPHE